MMSMRAARGIFIAFVCVSFSERHNFRKLETKHLLARDQGVSIIGTNTSLRSNLVARASYNNIEHSREDHMKSSGLAGLCLTTIVWYLLTIFYNSAHKLVAHEIRLPLTIAAGELLSGTLLLLPSWIFNKPNKDDFVTLWKKFGNIGFSHALATLLSALSMYLDGQYMTVHNIAKAFEPLICLSLTLQYDSKDLNEIPREILFSLVLIVLGTIVASPVTLSRGSWAAFVLHTLAIIFGQIVPTLSQRYASMSIDSTTPWAQASGRSDSQNRNEIATRTNNVIDNISNPNFIKVITLYATTVAIPVALVFESGKWQKVWHELKNQEEGPWGDVQLLVNNTVMAGMAHYLIQRCAFRLLQDISPLSLSVGCAARRAIIVTCSALFRLSPWLLPRQTLIGFSVAFMGVLGYLASAINGLGI